MTRRYPRRSRLFAIGAAVLALTAVTALPASAATPSCSTVTIAKLNTALGIDAVHVTSVRPATNPKALICSYYGGSGRAANEATINYLPASKASFAALKTSIARSHKVQTITALKAGAYSYDVGTEHYLYVLDGTAQVQLFAIVPLAKLEGLARELPSLS